MNELPTTPDGIVLGCVRTTESRRALRDTATELKIQGTFRAPEEIDPRPWMRTENQVQVGSCGGQALSSGGEYCNKVSGGEFIQFSAMASYIWGQEIDRTVGRDVGVTISSVIEGGKRKGFAPEELCAYTGKYFSQIPSKAVEVASQHRLGKHVVLKNYTDCFNWLASGIGFIEIGIDWTQELADNTTGLIESARGQNYGGHALAILGYTTRKDSQGRKYLLLSNSHGKQWGKDGWAEVAPKMFDDFGRSPTAEMAGGTDLQIFNPRVVDFRGMSG